MKRAQPLRESGAVLQKIAQRRSFAAIFLALGLSLFLGIIAFNLVYQSRLAVLKQEANDTLLLQVETLNSILEKPRLLPVLLGLDDVFLRAFDSDSDGDRDGEALNTAIEKAGLIASLAAVRDILFLDITGRVFTSVTKALDGQKPFVSAVEAAMQGRLGRLFFPNEGGDTPFYVFAAPVRDGGQIIGSIVVEVYLNEVLAAWALIRDPVIVTDRGGTILFSNRPNIQRFTFAAETATKNTAFIAHNGLLEEVFDAGPEGLSNYVESARFLPLLDWTLHALVREKPARNAAWQAAIIMGSIPLIIGAFLWLLLRRAFEIKMRQRRERAEALRLERQVRDRTADLRNAQARLVQSAKLAAIGQLSATLSHEYNQPLAAIQAHAANAQAFLKRGNLDKVEDGLTRISAMVSRMDALSKTLLSFARKPRSELRIVNLQECLTEAMTLVAPTARQQNVDLQMKGPFDVTVLGGQVRFQQVFVNLFKNAIDAFDTKQKDKWVRVMLIEETDDHLQVSIRDNGPGIPQKILPEIFEPFFTTKDVGEGLGIGLSIVYNILEDAGAQIDYMPNEPKGACFILTFKKTSLPHE